MKVAAVLLTLLLFQGKDDFDALKAKAEGGFAEEGLKLAEELVKKNSAAEARFVAGVVGSRVESAKERAEKITTAAKEFKGKPAAAKEAEPKVAAWGKKWAAEWRKVAKAGKGKPAERLDVEAELLDAAWEHCLAVALFNRRRAEAGVGTVEYDFALAYGCQMHARYLVRNPETKNRHTEDEGKAGWSEVGRQAAENGVIYTDQPLSPTIEVHLGTLFHRSAVLRPTLQRVGMGRHKLGTADTSVIDVGSAQQEKVVTPYFVYPPNGAADVFKAFMMENPPPIPREEQLVAGYPVTLLFYEDIETVKQASLKMYEAVGKQEIAGHLSSPEKPAHANASDNAGAIAFIPKANLKPNTKYVVEVSCQFRGEPLRMEWSFTTGTQKYPE